MKEGCLAYYSVQFVKFRREDFLKDKNKKCLGGIESQNPSVSHTHIWEPKTPTMAITGTGTGTALRDPPQIHRFPQTKYIDAVRWLPQLSAFDRFTVLSLFDSDSNTPSLEIHSLNPQSQTLTLIPQSTFSPPSRISSLKTSQTPNHKPLIAASTFSGSLHLLFANAVDASLESECSVPAKELHVGAVSCVDVKDGGAECVTVGEDGRVNLVGVTGSGLSRRRVFDSDGLVSYTAAKWASPVEFATGGYGFSLQWWDQRKPGGAVSQFNGNWWVIFTLFIWFYINF